MTPPIVTGHLAIARLAIARLVIARLVIARLVKRVRREGVLLVPDSPDQ